jgi:uncharacterized membrane protein
VNRDVSQDVSPDVSPDLNPDVSPQGGPGAATPGAAVPPAAVPDRRAHLLALSTLLALLVLCVAWEMWLAPLRPGGSAMVLKALPLLLPLGGLIRRDNYTMQWSSMLILLYFIEGVVRGFSDPPAVRWIGWLEACLSLVYFICVLVYLAPLKRAARARRRQ